MAHSKYLDPKGKTDRVVFLLGDRDATHMRVLREVLSW